MPTPRWSELEQTLGHVFKKRSMLEQSVTHSSLAYERATGRGDAAILFSPTARRNFGGPAQQHNAQQDTEEQGNAEPDTHERDTHEPGNEEQDNEQLEFLGDAVLGMIVADYLFRTYPVLQEGDLTRLRAQLVSRRHLGQVAAQISLGAYMRLGRGEERSGGRQKAVLLANALEAVIAALYLDGGLKAATRFVLQSVVEPYMDELHSALEAGLAMGDHKSALQEWLQAHKTGSAQYRVKAESGPDHRKRFLVEVEVVSDGEPSAATQVVAQGMGSTKKKAEQEAARLAYGALLAAERREDENAGVSSFADRAS